MTANFAFLQQLKIQSEQRCRYSFHNDFKHKDTLQLGIMLTLSISNKQYNVKLSDPDFSVVCVMMLREILH